MGTRTEGETGTQVPVSPPTPHTAHVLTDVVLERHRQIHLYGHNEDTPDGTGPSVCWAEPIIDCARSAYSGPMHATVLEDIIREDYELHTKAGEQLTWMHFLREEFAEAMQESDPAKLYTELVQVAAVAISWAEKIRQR